MVPALLRSRVGVLGGNARGWKSNRRRIARLFHRRRRGTPGRYRRLGHGRLGRRCFNVAESAEDVLGVVFAGYGPASVKIFPIGAAAEFVRKRFEQIIAGIYDG